MPLFNIMLTDLSSSTYVDNWNDVSVEIQIKIKIYLRMTEGSTISTFVTHDVFNFDIAYYMI